MASLLDRYDQIQRNPIGSNTALSRTTSDQGNPYGGMSTAGKQYRALEQSYGRALRILNHAARRGDARAALSAIQVRKDAMAGGLSPGGIRRVDEREADINSMTIGQRRDAMDLEKANENNRLAADEAGRTQVWEPKAVESGFEDTESGRPASPSRQPAPYYGDVETGGFDPNTGEPFSGAVNTGSVVDPKKRKPGFASALLGRADRAIGRVKGIFSR